jgi:hypothetical protein
LLFHLLRERTSFLFVINFSGSSKEGDMETSC